MTKGEAINWLINLRADIGKIEHQELWHYEQALAEIMEMLEESAEKHGRWIQENIVLTTSPVQYQWHCSECGMVKHWFTSEVLTKYCPNCGAKMERK